MTALTLIALVALLIGIQLMESRRMHDARVSLLQSIDESASGIAGAYYSAETTGRLTHEAAQAAATAAIQAMRYQGAEYVWINDMHPTMVMHPAKPELNGKPLAGITDPTGFHLFSAMVDLVAARGEGTIPYLWPRPGSDAPVPKLSYVKGFTPWGWIIGTGVYVDDLDAASRRLALRLSIIGIAVAAILGGLVWLLGRSVSAPVQALTVATRALSEGDLVTVIPGLDRQDEVGSMARALVVLRDAAAARRQLERDIEKERAEKDRRQAAMDRHTQDFGTSVSAVMTSLLESADAMQRTAEDVGDAARKTHAATSSTVEGAQASARDLASVASAAEQMARSVQEISQQVSHVTAAVQTAVDSATSTDSKVESLAAAADRIGDVVQLINTIARQTNLLALNATIEAARAGEAGKGFAVVASEVKALAAQTARATDEIGTQIVAIREATSDAVAAVRDVGSAIGQVESVAAAIAAAVEEQAAATREITNSVHTVSGATMVATEAMQNVLSIAEGTEVSSSLALSAARDVGGTAGTLRQEVTDFLSAMSSGDDSERRRFERIPGNGAQAGLTLGDGRRISGIIVDISRGGVLLEASINELAGADLQLALPGEAKAVRGRVVRCGTDSVVVCFRQDVTTRDILDRVLNALTRAHGKAA